MKNIQRTKVFISSCYDVTIISIFYGLPTPTVWTVNLLCFQPVFCMQSLDPPDSCLTLMVVPDAAYWTFKHVRWEIKLKDTNCVKTDSSSEPVLSYATAVSCNNCAVLKLSSCVSTFLAILILHCLCMVTYQVHCVVIGIAASIESGEGADMIPTILPEHDLMKTINNQQSKLTWRSRFHCWM